MSNAYVVPAVPVTKTDKTWHRASVLTDADGGLIVVARLDTTELGQVIQGFRLTTDDDGVTYGIDVSQPVDPLFKQFPARLYGVPREYVEGDKPYAALQAAA